MDKDTFNLIDMAFSNENPTEIEFKKELKALLEKYEAIIYVTSHNDRSGERKDVCTIWKMNY